MDIDKEIRRVCCSAIIWYWELRLASIGWGRFSLDECKRMLTSLENELNELEDKKRTQGG